REVRPPCDLRVGPAPRTHELVVFAQFHVRDGTTTLPPPLLLIRGVDDPLAPEEYEREVHAAVPGSQYLTLREAGHFPMAEQPAAVNQAITTFLDTLGATQTPPPREVLHPKV